MLRCIPLLPARTCPSGVVPLCPTPSFFLQCSNSSSPPTQHARDVRANLHVILALRLAGAASSSSRYFVHLQRSIRGGRRFLDHLIASSSPPRPARKSTSAPRPTASAFGIVLQHLLKRASSCGENFMVTGQYLPARYPCFQSPQSRPRSACPSIIFGTPCRLPKLGRAHVHAIRFRRSVADDVVADLAARRFDRL